MTLVSIVIPNYNHGAFLIQRIESVLNQSYTNIEVIILDDCSTDESRDIIERYRKNPLVKKIIFNEENSRSPFKQWAKGIATARGEYVWIAESDDYSDTQFLESLMSLTKKFPTASILYSNSYLVSERSVSLLKTSNESTVTFFPKNDLLKTRLICGIEIYNGSAVIFKRETALRHLPELSSFDKHGDYLLWTKLAFGNEGVFLNEPLNFFRQHDNSTTKLSINSEQSNQEYIAIFKSLTKYLNLLTLTESIKFFDRWALKFESIIRKGDPTSKRKNYHTIFKTSNWNFYFIWRFFYHRMRHISTNTFSKVNPLQLRKNVV